MLSNSSRRADKAMSATKWFVFFSKKLVKLVPLQGCLFLFCCLLFDTQPLLDFVPLWFSFVMHWAFELLMIQCQKSFSLYSRTFRPFIEIWNAARSNIQSEDPYSRWRSLDKRIGWPKLGAISTSSPILWRHNWFDDQFVGFEDWLQEKWSVGIWRVRILESTTESFSGVSAKK